MHKPAKGTESLIKLYISRVNLTATICCLNKRTALTAIVRDSPDAVSMPEIFTMQAPHPPSKHINLVPVKRAWLRMNTSRLVSIGTSFGVTGNQKVLIG